VVVNILVKMDVTRDVEVYGAAGSTKVLMRPFWLLWLGRDVEPRDAESVVEMPSVGVSVGPADVVKLAESLVSDAVALSDGAEILETSADVLVGGLAEEPGRVFDAVSDTPVGTSLFLPVESKEVTPDVTAVLASEDSVDTVPSKEVAVP
jgi:hypothetical protein